MATIRDVAKEAGVSIGTVSRAFNEYQDINSETKEKVLLAAQRLGYIPNINARSLSSKTSNCMGFIVSGFMNSDRRVPFIMSLLKGTYRYATEHQLEIALYTLDAEQQKNKSYKQFCVQHSLMGAVFSGVETNDVYFHQLVEAGFPCVMIDAYIRGNGLGCVSIDNVKAAEDLVDYLVAAGHRKIVIVEGKKEAEVSNYRLAGIYAAYSRHHMELTRDHIITGEFRETITYNRVRQYLQEHGKNDATAFLCFSDVMALGVMRAVRDLGYSVPDDFSVTGFDDIPIAGYTTPKLTTIEQDMEEVGYRAAELLQELVKTPGLTKSVYVPYRFVERNSVKKLK